MKIIKDKKSKYGSFDLIPSDGFVISHYFIDFESNLLIVAENTIKDSKKRNVPIPGYNRVFDPKIPKELSFEEYKQSFDYNERIIFSDDGKLKLISRRVHEPEPERDGYEEQLYDTESGELISKSSSVAFFDSKRENLLEKHLFRERLEIEYKQTEEQKHTIESYYEKNLATIQNGEIVLVYIGKNNTFKLVKGETEFELYVGSKIQFDASYKPKEVEYSYYKNFSNIQDFWNELIKDKEWYKEFRIFSNSHPVFTALVLQFGNKFRENLTVTDEEHEALYSNWERNLWTEDIRTAEYKQYCSVCAEVVTRNPRYHRKICSVCEEIVTDVNGNKVGFENSYGPGMGCRGRYIETKELYNSNICYIGSIKLEASEHYFGGIVIQRIE